MGGISKGLGVAAAVLAVCAVAASPAAAGFSGVLHGHSIGPQVFTFNGAEVECTTATLTGTAAEFPREDQDVIVDYSNCTAFGIVGVNISPAEYDLHTSGSVDFLNTITFNLGGICTITVPPQAGLGSLDFINGSGTITLAFDISGIAYTGNGGTCGTGGTNGTYTGEFEVEETPEVRAP